MVLTEFKEGYRIRLILVIWLETSWSHSIYHRVLVIFNYDVKCCLGLKNQLESGIVKLFMHLCFLWLVQFYATVWISCTIVITFLPAIVFTKQLNAWEWSPNWKLIEHLLVRYKYVCAAIKWTMCSGFHDARDVFVVLLNLNKTFINAVFDM